MGFFCQTLFALTAMHAQALDLTAFMMAGAPRAGAELASNVSPDACAQDWVPRLRAQAKAWPGRAVVLLAPESLVQGRTTELLRALPVAVLQAPEPALGRLAWRWAKGLQQQGNRVSVVSSRPHWGQLVDQRIDWLPKPGAKKVVSLTDFVKEAGLSSPRLAPGLAALVQVPGITPALAQDLLSRHGTLGALLEAAQDFLAFSQEPAKAQVLTQDDVRERVAQAAQALDFSRSPAMSPETAGGSPAWWKGSLDELNAAEALVDLGLSDCVQDFEEWLKPWRACDIARADWLQMTRAWEQARS